MEQTFITIHNLDPDATILFVSESVTDILGYHPSEVQGKSCFDYFHPDEVPFARSVHSRGVLLDKAAVLHYARIIIYRRSHKQERRAIEAPHIRRLFSSSPRDPRYHMLEHLSPKFKMPPMMREPRAALILNRFTRSLTVMFATNAVTSILGVTPDEIKEKSFWECVAENCVRDAINCLESAKANDSIAYLRFWSRDPRREEDFEAEDEEHLQGDENAEGRSSNSSGSDGGVQLSNAMDIVSDEGAYSGMTVESSSGHGRSGGLALGHLHSSSSQPGSRPGPHTARATRTIPPHRDGFQQPSILPPRPQSRLRRRRPNPSIELEAVVSCTSDGLVVVLRKARPPIPAAHPPLLPVDYYENGLFAAPWSEEPVTAVYPVERFHTFRPPLLTQHMPLQEHVKAAGGPPIEQLMRAIRDVASACMVAFTSAQDDTSTAGGISPRATSSATNATAPLSWWFPTSTRASYSPTDSHSYRNPWQ
ncbi:hypothetical protein DL764_009430 [Monosporascus ibericus]|uniref:PAS domain-containing protein n=1 Tax=Monosporascus ibericus TaxID=155417 RepID=A0A4Q4SXW9_9PEZI|nr:hypothetical protein DL764_009430 [Monosporascus ibericus]